MAKQTSERAILKIELLPSAIDAVDTHLDNTGMTHVATFSRLVLWLIDQDDVTQAAILGLLPESTRLGITQTILKKMAKEKSPRLRERRLPNPMR